MKNVCWVILLILLPAGARGAGKATAKLVEKELMTYPYSGPREVVDLGRIYPYHRFDGFSAAGEMQTWEMVELENEHIKLWVMPGVGGKVWGAVDKATGREFIYFNHVVKFRDVAMRGPWTSGGIELNFGVVGHSPWTSDKVDYLIREHPDGSVGCVVGAHDLALETDWRVEIVLPASSAYFETRVLWFNGSGWDRPAYQWMNAGIKAAGNLEYIFPGYYYLEHDGATSPWPLDEKRRALNRYDDNDFGHYKSYHVAGRYGDFWGAYWHDDDFGMAHTVDYADKPGKKIWIWGLSDYGMIWEDLLTDTDGQYTEVQSGRHLNQPTTASFRSPYKHAKLSPYTAQAWAEYWYPVSGMGGMIYGSPEMVLNIAERSDGRWLKVYAVSPLSGRLAAGAADKLLELRPGQQDSLLVTGIDPGSLTVTFDGKTVYTAKSEKISRPEKMPEDFDHNSLYGLYLQGRELEWQFLLPQAKEEYRQALEKETSFAPALVRMAGVEREQYRHSRADSLLNTALAIDTYDPAANYLRGILRPPGRRSDDTKEMLSIAAQSAEYGGAAWTELAFAACREGDYEAVRDYTLRALEHNPRNLTVLQLAVLGRLGTNDGTGTRALLDRLQEIDPLNDFARLERLRLGEGGDFDPGRLEAVLRGDFWYENYVTLADFYVRAGQAERALVLLLSAPAHPKIAWMSAYVFHLAGEEEKASMAVETAAAMDQSFIFPFRQTEYDLFKWVSDNFALWQGDYHLALLNLRADDRGEALRLLNKHDEVDFYPYFSIRASLQSDPAKRLADLQRACDLAPGRVYAVLDLARAQMAQEDWPAARVLLETQFARDETDYMIGMALADLYNKSGDPQASIDLMKRLNVLPYEGTQEGRDLWRDAHLTMAMRQIDARKYAAAGRSIAEARRWPVNLGVGKPYDDMVDERVEDFLDYTVMERQRKKPTEALIALTRYANREGYAPCRSADLLTALALRKQGHGGEADIWMHTWQAAAPDALSYRWARAAYDGNWDEAARIASESQETEEAQAYVTVSHDTDFAFLCRNADLIRESFR